MQDSIYNVDDAQPRKLDRSKYVAAHRLEWTPSKYVKIGLSESVIYGDRAPDVAFLVPVNLFIAAEENRGNNDNKTFAIDFTVKPIKRATVYGGLWVDDLTFGKVGTDYIQNKFGYLSGLILDNPFRLADTRFYSEYARMDPYAGAHYYAINRYTHWGRPLGIDLPPDADQLTIHGEWMPTSHWLITGETATMRHIETMTLNGYAISPGSILRLYPKEVNNESLPWGEGQGEFSHTFGLTGRYEVFEHCWLALTWQQVRTADFNTQPDLAGSYPNSVQHRPGLFDYGKATFQKTNTLWGRCRSCSIRIGSSPHFHHLSLKCKSPTLSRVGDFSL